MIRQSISRSSIISFAILLLPRRLLSYVLLLKTTYLTYLPRLLRILCMIISSKGSQVLHHVYLYLMKRLLQMTLLYSTLCLLTISLCVSIRFFYRRYYVWLCLCHICIYLSIFGFGRWCECFSRCPIWGTVVPIKRSLITLVGEVMILS